MNTTKDQQPAKYVKAQSGTVDAGKKLSKKHPGKKNNGLRTVLMVFALVIFLVGSLSVILISRKQELDDGPVAPNAPESKPAAYIPDEESCVTSFTVSSTKLACGDSICVHDSDCESGLECVRFEDENGELDLTDGKYYTGYCSETEYVEACEADPSYETCCEPEEELIACGLSDCATDSDCESGLECVIVYEEETNTSEASSSSSLNPVGYCSNPDYTDACSEDPSVANCCTEAELLSCGDSDCETDSDCEDDYVCITTDDEDSDGNAIKYCANEDYEDACSEDPAYSTCCVEPTTTVTTTPTETVTTTPTTTVTETTTPTTTTTPTATPTTVITTVITTVGCNDTCQENADCANISHICYNGRCRLDVNPTDTQCRLPDGTNSIERTVTVDTESGFADWFNYLKAGLGTLGIGALLLLLL